MSDFSNPYHADRPVEDQAMFFGRNDALLWIEQQVLLNRRLLIIHGPDLIGKTSLLGRLPGTLSRQVRFLHFECKPHQSQPLPQVLDAMTQVVTEQLVQLGLISSAPQPTDDPGADLASLLQQATASSKVEHLLLVVDDVHLLEESDAEYGLTSFFDTVTSLLAAVPPLRFLFTFSEVALKRLSHPLLAGAETFRLGPLNSDAAQQLITRPSMGVIRFELGAVNRIADISSNHPYYLQLFCQLLFDRCVRGGVLNQSDVDVVLSDLLSQPNERFRTIWKQSGWSERAAMVAMSHLKGTHDLTTRREVFTYLEKLDPEVDRELVERGLERLADRGVLVRMGALSYRFAIKLFRYWLERQFDPADVLSRIDWEHIKAHPAGALEGEPAPASRKGCRWGVGHWIIAALSLTAVFGIGIFVIIISGAWRLLGIFPPTPTPVPIDTPVSFISTTPTPTITPVPLTPTPTNPIIVARTLPSIAYTARNAGGDGEIPDWQLFVMNADGSNPQRLTYSDGEDITPIWSPDGRYIAYISKHDENRDIFILPAPSLSSFGADGQLNTESLTPVNVTQHPANDWTESWLPDGKQIAFSSNRDGYWDLFVINIDGTGVTQLTDDGAGRLSPVWSPDGEMVAFSGRQGDQWDIFVAPAPKFGDLGNQITQERRLTTADGNDISPVFSPDSQRIVFESSRDGNAEIYMMNANGSNQINISNYPGADDHSPVWAPDGKHLLFYSGREGNWDLFLMDDDGQNVINLTNTPGTDEQEPHWRP